jgi:DNA-binding transcriptional regulator YiaG
MSRAVEPRCSPFALRPPTLRNWKQGRFNPDPAARALLKIVSKDPERALRILAE